MEAREEAEVEEVPGEECSARMVVLFAMQALVVEVWVSWRSPYFMRE